MWSQWSESAKSSLSQALEKTQGALEVTGDALTKAATSAGKSAREAAAASATSQTTTTTTTTATATSSEETANDEPQTKVSGRYATTASMMTAEDADETMHKQQEQILKNLQAGWSSVVETTKASIKVAQEKVEEQQHKLEERMKKAVRSAYYYKRDPKLPLDVPALKDAQVVYVTDRLITMSHPAMASTTDASITGERKLAAVGHLLQRRHEGRFMVWNLSEVDYDVDILDDQVLTYSFPGSPSPPLGLLMKLLVSMESWLKADDRNVAVVHCLTGKGRTSTVLAAFLCWMGQAGFDDIYDALAYIAKCKQMTTEDLVIPSQRRYASYFKNMLDGVRPSQPPLRLQRVIMSEAPRYAMGPPRDNDDNSKDDNNGNKQQQQQESDAATKKKSTDTSLRMGCAPYLQIFKGGKLLHTAPASLHFQQSPDELPFCQVADGSISFTIDQILQGDILVRCRHLTTKQQRISMFRAAFHTGYVPPKVMRLTKSQLDGACNDDRFPEDFFLDLIFEPVDAEEASKMLLGEDDVVEDGHATPAKAAAAAAAATEAPGNAGGATTVTASAYDSMLHRDSRFWDVIAARRQEQQQQQQQQLAKDEDDDDSATKDPMWGSTVGRRRDFSKKAAASQKSTEKTTQEATAVAATTTAALETFRIGGEFDFLPETYVEPEAAADTTKNQPKSASAVAPAQPPKKDSLMEALMGALDEEVDDDDDDDDKGDVDDMEEIVFDTAAGTEEDSAAATVREPDSTAGPATTETAAAAAAATDTATSSPATSSAPSTTEEKQKEDDKDNQVPEAPPTEKSSLSQQASTGTSTSQAIHEMEDLLADAANLDLDSDMDALLDAAAAAAGGDGDDDIDVLDLDDAELEDLENFLSPK